MNKNILKFLIIGLYIFLLICIVLGRNKKNTDEITMNNFNYTNNYSALSIPDKINNEEDYLKVIAILDEISLKYDTSYLKKITDYSYNKVNDKIDYSSDQTNIYFYFSNSSKIEKQSNAYNNATFYISTIKKSVENKEYEGTFFIDLNDEPLYLEAMELFKNKYNMIFDKQYKIDQFVNFDNNKVDELILSPLTNLSNYLVIGAVTLIIILFLWLMVASPEIAVYKMNGYSIHRIAHTMILDHLAIVTISTIVITFFTKLLSYEIVSCLVYMIALFLIITLVTYISIYYSIKVSAVTSLNKKSFITEKSFIGVFIVKALLLTFIISSVIPLAEVLYYSTKAQNTENDSADYSILYPIYLGKNYSDFVYSSEFTIDIDDAIYHYLNEQGALLVNDVQYQTKENEYFYRSIFVNPNYLTKFPILDTQNKIIDIQESEKNRMILVPEKYKNQESKIREMYSLKEYSYLNSEFSIVWIKNNQEIKTFNPDQPSISDVIVLDVLTENNSHALERQLFKGDDSSPLKIPNNEHIKQYMLALLKENNLSDNLPSLVPISDISLVKIQLSLGSVKSKSLEVFISTIVMVVIISYLTIFYFKINKKIIVLKRVNGFSMLATYRNYFLLLIAQYVVLEFFKVAKIINYEMFNVVIIIYLLIEFLITITRLLYLERKNKVSILEGE